MVAKFCTKATNLLNFCMAGSDGLDLALGAGAVAGVGFAVSRVYTRSIDGSGLLVAWVVGFWGSSLASFPLLSSLNKGRTSSSFFHGPYTIPNCGASYSSLRGASTESTFNSS